MSATVLHLTGHNLRPAPPSAADLVDVFHRRPGTDCQRPDSPTVAVSGALDRVGYVEEETHELRAAVEAGDVVATADALADLVYTVYGAAWRFGIPLDDVVTEVHRSNMTKTATPGDGKAVKGPGYMPPDIAGVLRAPSGMSPDGAGAGVGAAPTAVSPATVDAVIALGQLSLAFGRVPRITRHEDGERPETDTDHTVMLALIACALAPQIRADLDLGLVAQYALVHDLVEVFAGDTPTLRVLDAAARAAKAAREREAYERIAAAFGATLPWLPDRIGEYEARRTPEARYVKALDKLMPKITHLLNGLATIRRQQMDVDELRARYTAQRDELRGYAADFPALLDLHAALVARVLARFAAAP